MEKEIKCKTCFDFDDSQAEAGFNWCVNIPGETQYISSLEIESCPVWCPRKENNGS